MGAAHLAAASQHGGAVAGTAAVAANAAALCDAQPFVRRRFTDAAAALPCCNCRAALHKLLKTQKGSPRSK